MLWKWEVTTLSPPYMQEQDFFIKKCKFGGDCRLNLKKHILKFGLCYDVIYWAMFLKTWVLIGAPTENANKNSWKHMYVSMRLSIYTSTCSLTEGCTSSATFKPLRRSPQTNFSQTLLKSTNAAWLTIARCESVKDPALDSPISFHEPKA